MMTVAAPEVKRWKLILNVIREFIPTEDMLT